MTHYLVKNQYDEALKVKLYNEPIEDNSLRETGTGKWPACLSPMSRASYVPHYFVETYEDPENGLGAIYHAQFFVEDMEYDSFIIEVVEVGGYCETYMHNSHLSILDSSMLTEIAYLVEEIEVVLAQLSEKHDKALNIKRAA